jgi:hypothetical protein
MQSESFIVNPSPVAGLLRSFWGSLAKLSHRMLARREPRRLRLCETISLGNRGYLAVVRYDEQQFLVGGTTVSVALIAQLARGPATPALTSDEELGNE